MLATDIQRKAVFNLLENASTGNEILTILDWFVSTLSEPQPTLVMAMTLAMSLCIVWAD